MIGEVLVAHGLISEDGLAQALAEQRRRAAAGERIRLGELLVEMGFLTTTELKAFVVTRIVQVRGSEQPAWGRGSLKTY